jgi:hypothetical protein
MGLRGRKLTIDEVVEDLVVAAGVLVREGNEHSFGHLTFQEHLAARRLWRLGRPQQVLRHLRSDWWHEVLLFYAGEVGDITELVELCEEESVSSLDSVSLLGHMIHYAPYTQQVAKEVVDERIRIARESIAREREGMNENDVEDMDEAPGEAESAPDKGSEPYGDEAVSDGDEDDDDDTGG